MKLTQLFAPVALALTTSFAATTALAQATACVNNECVTGSSSASIRMDGNYITRNGVPSGARIQPVTPAQPYRYQPVQPVQSYRYQPVQPVQSYRPQTAQDAVTVTRPKSDGRENAPRDVLLFSFNGQYDDFVCDAALLNKNLTRNLKTMCTDRSKVTYAFNIVRNPFEPVAGPINSRIFCTQKGTAEGAGSQMEFNKTYFAPGEPLDCIKVIHIPS